MEPLSIDDSDTPPSDATQAEPSLSVTELASSGPRVAQAHGGVLTPWQKGQSGNPIGRLPRPVDVLLKRLEDKAIAEGIADDYLALMSDSDGRIRLDALKDLFTRVGFGTQQAAGPQATAQVVNIIKNTPDLGV